MDGLREGVSLRGYAQKDPKLEYQREGFALFEEMGGRVDQQVAELVFKFVLPDPGAAASAAAGAAAARGRAAAPQAAGARPGLPAGAARARARRGAAGGAGRRRAGGRARGPQRSVPVRERQEVQEVLRRGE